ncbi:MAG: ribosome small subunit-dependent GTPase A [Bacteroidales bacterium]|nr:ribosome small subunit-dependent GTPase A [Bacteroidales bacterium]
MKLEELGFDDHLGQFRAEHHLTGFETGRVITEHKERYNVLTEKGEFEAEITGNMRFTAENRLDYPAVGDWVTLTVYDDSFAIIHQIFPRKSVLVRQAVGRFGDKQVIAANIDFAFIVQSADRDFNINRLERYLTICYAAPIRPIIILSKTDLLSGEGLSELVARLNQRIADTQLIPLSNQTMNGYNTLLSALVKGKTYCFLGSSGVGKSTIINNLAGQELIKTNNISFSTGKGKHTTSRRELIILSNGSILIDTPGLREVGIADTSDGLESTFENIYNLSTQCRFNNCTHTREKGCAILEAVEKGVISRESYNNYLKMVRERARFNTSVAEKRKKDKVFGKMCKEAVKYRKQKKF